MATEDVLTEGEIDALMEKVSDSLEPRAAGEYQTFDFSAREQVLLSRMILLGRIAEQHSEDLSAALKVAFDLEIAVKAPPSVLVTAKDLSMALGEVAGVTQLKIKPFEGNCYVIAAPELLNYLVNVFFGGASSPVPLLSQRTSLTPSELRICELVNATVIDTMGQAWAQYLGLEPGDSDTEMTTDSLQSEPDERLLLRTTFSVNFGEFDSTLELLLPFDDVAAHKEQLMPSQQQTPDRGNHAEWESYFRREMLSVPVSVSAVLSSQEMPLLELLGLQVGAVLPLKMPEHVTLRVEDTSFAHCEYGAHEGNKAVKIHHITAQADKAR